jgi:hypothetical protein
VTADVVIGWVHPGHVHTGFMESLLLTLARDQGADGGNRIAGWTGVRCTANVSAARNQLVDWLLASPAEWLLMVDTDMVWSADALDRLLEHADPVRSPVVGGLCFAREFATGRIWPTLYELEQTDGQSQFLRFHSWAPDSLFPVDGTGAAFLLVHRTVFEQVAAKQFSPSYPWFQETEGPAGRISEDLTFCLRARDCGVPIAVHTGVQVGHVKEVVVTAQDYLAQQMMFEQTGRSDAVKRWGFSRDDVERMTRDDADG